MGNSRVFNMVRHSWAFQDLFSIIKNTKIIYEANKIRRKNKRILFFFLYTCEFMQINVRGFADKFSYINKYQYSYLELPH